MVFGLPLPCSSLVQVLPEQATSWAPVATVLTLMPTDELALAEVKAGLLEFRQARELVVASVLDAMRAGCSKPPGGGAKAAWDHSAIDAETVVRKALQLEHFPRIGDSASSRQSFSGGDAPGNGAAHGGGNGTTARRTSIVARRQSLARLAEEAEGIVSSAKRIGRLRELLQANDWAEVRMPL